MLEEDKPETPHLSALPDIGTGSSATSTRAPQTDCPSWTTLFGKTPKTPDRWSFPRTPLPEERAVPLGSGTPIKSSLSLRPHVSTPRKILLPSPSASKKTQRIKKNQQTKPKARKKK